MWRTTSNQKVSQDMEMACFDQLIEIEIKKKEMARGARFCLQYIEFGMFRK